MQPDLSNLPELAQRMVGIIGLAPTLLLVDRHGGQSFRLYATGEGISRLTSTIGEAAALQLLDTFGSDEFEIPLCTAVLRAARNAKIHAEFDRMTLTEGRSAREAVRHLADEYRPMLERTVWRILKKSSIPGTIKPKKAVDSRQMSLI